MANEDFTTYTELDDNSRIAVTASKITWAELTVSEDAHVYKDKGAGYFDGDFTHLLTVMMTGGTQDGEAYCWAITNIEDTMRAIDTATGDYLSVYIYQGATTKQLYMEECDGGALHLTNYVITPNIPYYLKVVRDESVGTYGTLYCYIYSDSARTTLLTTLSLTLHTSKKDFRYIYALNTLGAGTTQNTSGYCENLALYDAEPGYAETYPSDPTTRVTSITHRYDRGTFTTELNLGEVVSDFGVPDWGTKPRGATPEDEEYIVLPGAKEAIEKALAETTWGKDIEEKKLVYEAKKKAAQAKTELEQEIAKLRRMIPAPTPTAPVSRDVVTDPALRRYLPKAPAPEVEPWWQKFVGDEERIGL